MDLKALRAKASDPLGRMREGADGGHAVAIDPEGLKAVLELVDALQSALPSIGKASDLETVCEACGGSGGDCLDCEGIGTVLTEAGEVVWAMVTRRLARAE